MKWSTINPFPDLDVIKDINDGEKEIRKKKERTEPKKKKKRKKGFLSKPGKKVSINLGIKKQKMFSYPFSSISVVFIFNSNWFWMMWKNSVEPTLNAILLSLADQSSAI